AEVAGAAGDGAVHAMQHGGDDEPESFFRRLAGESDLARVGMAEVQRHGVAEDGGVGAGFIAKMVVDGGDVGVRTGTDFADGSGLETLLGEDLTGGLDEAGAGGIRAFGGGGWNLEATCHLNNRLKQLFISCQEGNLV